MTIEELYQIYLEHPLVTTDSRNCPSGSLFFALKGERFDGNRFALVALQGGCSYAVVDEAEYAIDNRFILVDDVLTALQQLAAMHRMEWGRTVIQITGTNGKTSTKELISAVLSEKYNVLFTQGNFNNHIGVPLTLLRLTDEHQMAVVETGANHPGEIAALCHIAQPDFGLITNVGRAHLEGFGSFEGVKRTKGELYDDIRVREGHIFLNAFDDDLRKMAESRGYVLGDTALPYAEGRVEACTPFLTFQWREDVDSPWHSVKTHLVGAYNIDNVRAAVTLGLYFNVPADRIDKAIAAYVPRNNRSEFRQTLLNRLIVDAYNANPASMEAALTNFMFVEDGKKMVILGDMRELGADSLSEHLRILDTLSKVSADKVWLVGPNFAEAVNEYGFNPDGLMLFSDVGAVKDELAAHPIEGFTILIKGSNGLRLFELPESL